jgi:hypothetical protein
MRFGSSFVPDPRLWQKNEPFDVRQREKSIF